jgi:hypothetical protein
VFRGTASCFLLGLAFPLWLVLALSLLSPLWTSPVLPLFVLRDIHSLSTFLLVLSFLTFVVLSFVLSIVHVCCRFFCPWRSFSVSAHCVFLTQRWLVSFLFCFLFVVVVFLINLIPSLHFSHSLQSFCFSVHLLVLFVLFLSFILSCAPDLFFVVLPRIRLSSVLSLVFIISVDL